jgi:hypothetical protein
MQAARLLGMGVNVDGDKVVGVEQRQFRHFVIPGKDLAAMKFCHGFARGSSHACRSGFNKPGGAWEGGRCHC